MYYVCVYIYIYIGLTRGAPKKRERGGRVVVPTLPAIPSLDSGLLPCMVGMCRRLAFTKDCHCQYGMV